MPLKPHPFEVLIPMIHELLISMQRVIWEEISIFSPNFPQSSRQFLINIV